MVGPGGCKEIVERPVPSAALTVSPADNRPTRSAGKGESVDTRVGSRGGRWNVANLETTLKFP